MTVQRIDSAVRLDGAKRTPQGGLRVDAALARPGILKYRQPNGSWISEYLSPEEAFNADSMASLTSAPVTKLHPPEMVSRKNWSKYSRGNVGETVRQDGNKIAATLYLQDADLADAVERGDMKEVSCGYACDLVNKPGVSPEGERYDRLQINRRYNHVAVVPMGRAGSEIALRLDASDNVITEDEGESMKTFEKIDGVDYEVGTDAHKAAAGRRDEAAKADKTEREKLQARADKGETDAKSEKTRADAAEAELGKLRKDASDKARAALEVQARKVLGAAQKFDAADGKPMSDAAIRLAVAQKANPELKFDGKGDAYAEVLFDMAIVKADEAQGALGSLHSALHAVAHVDAAGDPTKVDLNQMRADMTERLNGNAKKKA